MTVIKVSDIFAEVEWKEIKNVHLTIYPPNARVHAVSYTHTEPTRRRGIA